MKSWAALFTDTTLSSVRFKPFDSHITSSANMSAEKCLAKGKTLKILLEELKAAYKAQMQKAVSFCSHDEELLYREQHFYKVIL